MTAVLEPSAVAADLAGSGAMPAPSPLARAGSDCRRGAVLGRAAARDPVHDLGHLAQPSTSSATSRTSPMLHADRRTPRLRHPPHLRRRRPHLARVGVGGLGARCTSRRGAACPAGCAGGRSGCGGGVPAARRRRRGPGGDAGVGAGRGRVRGGAGQRGGGRGSRRSTCCRPLQATFVRELEARTPDALRHVPDELACALVCTKRSAENLFLRAWGTAQHPALGDAWAAGAIEARKIDVILDEISKAGDRPVRERRGPRWSTTRCTARAR